MSNIIEGCHAEIFQQQHALHDDFGLIVTPEDMENTDYLRALLDSSHGPSQLTQLLERYKWMVFRCLPPGCSGSFSEFLSPETASQPAFWHTDSTVTGDTYTTLYNDDGKARVVAETGLGDREVIVSQLVNFLEAYPESLEKAANCLTLGEAKIKNSKLRTLPPLEDAPAWASILLTHMYGYGGNPILWDFAQFLESDIARYRLGTNELLCFTNAPAKEGSGLLHARIVPDDARETVGTYISSFRNLAQYSNYYRSSQRCVA